MKTLAFACISILLAGCHGAANSSAPASSPSKAAHAPKPAPEPTAAGKAFRLQDEPAGGKGVLAVRQDSKDGDEVVIVGRIGGSVKPFSGRAAFTIVDASIKPCNEIGDDDCPTPWDYCCGVGKEDLAKGTALIKLVGDDGQTRADDARTLLGLTELQTVVVRGKAKRDDAGNLTVNLSGIFVRPRKGLAMNSGIDLRELAVRRDAPETLTEPNRSRHVVSRIVVPAVILVGFVGLAAYALRDRLLPARSVTVVPVVVERGTNQAAGTPLFQAAGWVEARPTPIVVTALTDGVIEKLLVVEGQAVEAGEPIAHLVDADAKIALKSAEAELRLREAEVAQAQVAAKAAKLRVEQPVHLEAALAESDANLAKSETERANLPFQIRSADARYALAKNDLDIKVSAGTGAVPSRVLAQAQSEVQIALAAVDELKQRQTSLDREIAALTARRDAIRKQLQLKTDENRQFEDATVSVTMAEARVQQSQANVAAARLRLDRLTIRAPQGGRVLALTGRPGKRVSGLDPNSMFDASTVAVLYNPKMLQVRADVPLDQVGKVVPGHPVRIETEALPGRALDGIVLQSTGQADIQKNTLQVKVAITDPPPVLKPEMLARATFLAAALPADAPMAETARFFVPRSLVDSELRVWMADPSGVARLRTVTLGIGGREDLVEIIAGVGAGDKLIAAGREGLSDGDRISVTGEDSHLGIAAPTHGAGAKMDRRSSSSK